MKKILFGIALILFGFVLTDGFKSTLTDIALIGFGISVLGFVFSIVGFVTAENA